MEDSANAEPSSSPSSILHPPSSSSSHPLGWAAFLAVSWTWCIGMYLPVLMVRDFGVWAWAVFAIPNVLGAAAMGWTVRSPQASARMVEAHGTACRWFSWVTIAFQLYFAAWFVREISPVGAGLAITIAFAAAVYAIGAWRGDRGWRLAAAGVFAISLGAMIFGFAHHIVPALPPPKDPKVDLLYLALVCAFGFALNPYFDLTFHRARQAASSGSGETGGARDARVAFGLGFGAFFLLMILFTLAYSGVVTRPVRPAAAIMLLFHISAQLGFTVAAHAREWFVGVSGDRRGQLVSYAAVATILVAVVLGVAASLNVPIRHLSPGEFIYRGFMIFYGLVFPTYAWICMLPTWHDPQKPAHRALAVFAIACLVAAPMYYLGFIENRMVWLVPALGVVLAARWAVMPPIKTTVAEPADPGLQ